MLWHTVYWVIRVERYTSTFQEVREGYTNKIIPIRPAVLEIRRRLSVSVRVRVPEPRLARWTPVPAREACAAARPDARPGTPAGCGCIWAYPAVLPELPIPRARPLAWWAGTFAGNCECAPAPLSARSCRGERLFRRLARPPRLG